MLRIALLSLVWAGLAEASPTFPSVVSSHEALGKDPICSLCHKNNKTGLGTVTTPFGVTLRAYGAVQTDEAKLVTALDGMADAGVDSDADGVGDIDELKAGTDPNIGLNGGLPSIVYGCGADSVPVLFGVLGVLVLSLSRRRE